MAGKRRDVVVEAEEQLLYGGGGVMEAGVRRQVGRGGRDGWGIRYFFFSWQGRILPKSYPLQSCLKIGVFFDFWGYF